MLKIRLNFPKKVIPSFWICYQNTSLINVYNDMDKLQKMALTALTDKTYEDLNWELFQFEDYTMYRIFTIPDGNCMFHAISNAFFDPYRKGSLGGVPYSQERIVKDFRRDLAIRLGEKSVEDPAKTNYEMLGNGAIKMMSETMPQFSLSAMKKELDSNAPVDNLYNEHISNMINVDIYILSAEKQDVYTFGDDYSRLYKNRESIVILYLPGHYELIGVRDANGEGRTMFPYNHPFIQRIRKRIAQLCKGSFVKTKPNPVPVKKSAEIPKR